MCVPNEQAFGIVCDSSDAQFTIQQQSLNGLHSKAKAQDIRLR